MTKRKASDCDPTPFATPRTKHACFAVPQWVLDDGNKATDRMIISPPVQRASIFKHGIDARDGTTSFVFGQEDTEMGSPTQRSQASPRQTSVHHAWRSTSSKFGRSAAFGSLVDQPPVGEISLVPRAQFDALQSENAALRETLAALTKELAESKSKIIQLEMQWSSSGNGLPRGCLATGFRTSLSPLPATHPVYFAPHQYIPVPQYGH